MNRALLKIRRQDDPEDLPYWEIFEVPYELGVAVSSALTAIEQNPVTAEGNPTTPVVWDCSCNEGICGSCTMVINGKARQACKVMLEDFEGPIVLEPLSKFPIVRDLKVDRTKMLDTLKKHECWVWLDDLKGSGFTQCTDKDDQERTARFLDCVLCGACSEACPQVNARSAFTGAFVFSHVAHLNDHPIGKHGAKGRIAALGGRGGIEDCAGAENCEMVCPRGIPLVEAASKLGWDTLAHSVKRFFWG
ncbi:MAG: succinate dehydrogenase iron-sulfur subunit [Pseudomonadota bacterium]